MGEVLTITPTESVEIRSSSAEALEVEATYGAGGEPPPRHFHPQQEEHFEVLAIDRLHREGRVGRNGMPGPLAFGVMLTEYRDVFRLAGPDWLLRPALAAIAVAGRARGYSA